VPVGESQPDLVSGDCDWLAPQAGLAWGAPIVTARACEIYEDDP
jgi:hypothetical protein